MDYFDGAFNDEETCENYLPPIEISGWKTSPDALFRVLRGLGRIQCTEDEICAVLGIQSKEWKAVLKSNPEAMALVYQGTAEGKIALRRKQMHRAMQGSDAMLKHLGKHVLGQHDQLTVNDGRLSTSERLALLEEVERRHEASLVDVTQPSSGRHEPAHITRDATSITHSIDTNVIKCKVED